jgi:hypothetical protein
MFTIFFALFEVHSLAVLNWHLHLPHVHDAFFLGNASLEPSSPAVEYRPPNNAAQVATEDNVDPDNMSYEVCCYTFTKRTIQIIKFSFAIGFRKVYFLKQYSMMKPILHTEERKEKLVWTKWECIY